MKASLDVTGNQIRLARHALRWSQGDLAEVSGVSRVTISGVESGAVTDPKRATLVAIVRALERAGAEITDDGVRVRERA
jgi:transcriptional regulator with XRE-family HTH domain